MPLKKQPLPDVVTRIDQLLDLGDDGFVAEQLNTASIRNWRKSAFTKGQIAAIRKGHELRPHKQRRRAAGYATAGELATRYNVTRSLNLNAAASRPRRRLLLWPGQLGASSCGRSVFRRVDGYAALRRV